MDHASHAIRPTARAGTSVTVNAISPDRLEVAVSNRGALPSGGVETAVLTAAEANALIAALQAAVGAI